MTALPSKEELLAFQARWMRPAGLAALGGAFIVTASIVLQRVGLDLPDANSDADQLVFTHAHSGRLILATAAQAIGFVLFALPLYFVFRSASGRSERVRRALVGLVVVGPLAFGVGLAISSVGSSQAADKFVEQAPAKEQEARQQAEAAAAGAQQPKSEAKTGTSTSSGATATTAARPPTPDQAANNARENLADDLNRDTTLLIVGGLLSTIGVLSLVFGLIYTAVWSMRVGLLSRFWGLLIIAFGLFLILPIFPPVPGVVLWFAAIGLMFLGVWPRPLPPAWAAGEAIPWPRPGEDLGPPSSPGGTVEGSGREISEPALPEEGAPTGERPHDQAPETQGPQRRKRKRRQ